MENLQISNKTAKRLYPESPIWFQEVLKETFGEECFKKREFTDIKTFEDACDELGTNPSAVFNSDDQPDEVAYKKLKVIVKAINGGWLPDWSNTNQKKWWPWFNLSSGFGFCGSTYDCTLTAANVGSRLCFESEAKSDYTAKQFINLYEELLTIKK